jgi:hypothetical protein
MADARSVFTIEGRQQPAYLQLQPLDRLVGRWTSEATHPTLPGVVVSGTLTAEWLEGGHFLIIRTRNDHPDFPDAVSIIGFADIDRVPDPNDVLGEPGAQMSMHYFDSRGVTRVYDALVDAASWRLWRNAPGFAQTFVGEFADDGDTVLGLWRLCDDGANWRDDLRVVYRRE